MTRGYRTGCSCQGCPTTDVFKTPRKWMCQVCIDNTCTHGISKLDEHVHMQSDDLLLEAYNLLVGSAQ